MYPFIHSFISTTIYWACTINPSTMLVWKDRGGEKQQYLLDFLLPWEFFHISWRLLSGIPVILWLFDICWCKHEIMNTQKHIKKHFNKCFNKHFNKHFYPKYPSFYPFYCKILHGVLQCLPHFQSKNNFHHYPKITQPQLCIVDFLPPIKELLWNWTFLKCPAVVGFGASTYFVNYLLPLMLHSQHFQIALWLQYWLKKKKKKKVNWRTLIN